MWNAFSILEFVNLDKSAFLPHHVAIKLNAIDCLILSCPLPLLVGGQLGAVKTLIFPNNFVLHALKYLAIEKLEAIVQIAKTKQKWGYSV